MDEELEAALNEVPVAGYVEEIGDIEPRKVLRINKYQGLVSATIAVSDTSEDIYWHRKFRERIPLTARRFLAFALGRFPNTDGREYLCYARYVGKTDGSEVEELSLIPVESIKDFFTLAKSIKVVTY
jgi:hypothetical protein